MQSFFEIWLIFWLCFHECLNFLKIVQNLFTKRKFLDINAKSGNSSHHLRIKERVSQSNVISEAKFSFAPFQKLFNCVHSSNDPLFCELNFICLKFFVDQFEQSQILIRMNSRIYYFAKSSYLGFENWIMGQKWEVRMILLKKLTNGHGLD